MSRHSIVFLMAVAACFLGCKEDPSIHQDQLTGHWAVYGAERDGKNTTLLNGAVFHFQEDGTMQTNITGQESSGKFDLNENTINFQGSESMLFEIGSLTNDTLTLHTELQGMHFILDLQRKNTESQ